MATPDAEALAATLNGRRFGFDCLYGLELVAVSDAEVRGRLEVREELCQRHGLVHGGVYAAIAESLTSIATSVALPDKRCVGLSNSTSFLRPVTAGSISAHARRLHAGRTTWVWDVDCSDDSERLCAITRMTIAIR